ncbi:MAG: hypothetical protein K2Y39_15400 [Candidatus Obscuribacterales bacterium]|nr:hypothetical protein [Candidatus Obscuribacterales bacterium]
MVERNQYEPSLNPINEGDKRGDGENQVTENTQLTYSDVMRANYESPQRAEAQQVTDRTNVSDIKDPDIIKAFTLVDNAKEAAMLLNIQESKQPDNTPIQMADANGRPFTITLGQLKQKLIEDLSKNSDFKGFNDPAQLREFIGKSTDAALTLSAQTREKYEARSRESDTNVNARNELAKQLGFTPTTREIPDGNGGKKTITSYDVTQKDVDARLATTTDAAQKANLEKLKGLLTNYDSIQKERNALSAVDVTAAQMMMGGLTHKAGEQTLDGLPATRNEVMRAYETINKAGRGNAQLEQTPQYQMIKEQSSAMYADIQLQRSKDAVNALQEADKLRVAGKPTEAQAKYEEALQKVKGVDMATITTQWQSQMREFNTVQEKLTALGNPPSNPQEAQRLATELQQRQQIGMQLEQIIQVGKEVKTEYARFLNEQGKPGEALPLLTSVASGTPQELLAGDTTFTEQLEKAQSLGSITSGDAEKHRVLYEQAMAAKDWTTAEREMAALKAASTKASETTIQGAKDRVAVMDKRQAEIKAEMEDLKKNTTMEADAKALRQQQLDAELKGYDVLRKGLADGIPAAEKAAKDHANQLRYMEGIIAYSKEDKETAHKIFKELQAEAPEIANNKDYQLDALLEDTRKKGWLERHWDTIVSVGKIVAVVGAIAVAGAVTGGVGAVALAGALGAAGVFTVGAVGHGVAKANDWKSTDNYQNWRPGQDLLMGAVGGAGGAALQGLFAAGGTAGLGGRMVAAGSRIAATEGATFSSTALNVGGNALIKGTQLASQATTFKGALAVGTTYGYGGEAINSFTTGKQFSFGDATSKAVGMSAALYGAGKTGGLGHWKGSMVYGGVRAAEEQGRAMAHGKEFGQAAMDSLGSFGEHSFQAFAVGTFANMNAAAQAGRFTMARALPEGQALNWNSARQFAVNLPGASGSNLLSQGRLVFGEGVGLTPKAGLVFGTAAAGLTGWQVYQGDAAYADSRMAKEWDDKDQMTRMRMNQAMEQLSKPVVRPTIKRPQE